MGFIVALLLLIVFPACSHLLRRLLRGPRWNRISPHCESHPIAGAPTGQGDLDEGEKERLIVNGRMTSVLGQAEYHNLMGILARLDQTRCSVHVPELHGDWPPSRGRAAVRWL